MKNWWVLMYLSIPDVYIGQNCSRNLKIWVLLKGGFSQKFSRNWYSIKLNSQYVSTYTYEGTRKKPSNLRRNTNSRVIFDSEIVD